MTVKLLGEKINELGYLVKCHFEGDADSPLDLCWTAYLSLSQYENLIAKNYKCKGLIEKNIIHKSHYVLLRYKIGNNPIFSPEIYCELHNLEFCYNSTNQVPISKFTEVFFNLWNDYAKSEDEYDYEIFDASLVSHITNDLIRNYNASQEEIIKHLNCLLSTIKMYNPVAFYLFSNDVRERVKKARISRNQTPLTEEKLSFWEKRKQLDMPILSKIDIDVHMVNISNEDWDVALDNIISIIKLS